MLIALDRMERGGSGRQLSERSAVEDFERDYGHARDPGRDASPICWGTCAPPPIPALAAHAEAVERYRRRYGV